MFRQVAEYSITTHQRGGKNSSKPALLAFLLALLLAQFDPEIPRVIAHNVLNARSHKPKLAGNEPDAKAILPEPQSVKNTSSPFFRARV